MTWKKFRKKWEKKVSHLLSHSEFLFRLYCSIQRAIWGYSNHDVYLFENWFVELAVPMLEGLIERKAGVPIEFLYEDGKYGKSPEKGFADWVAMVREIQRGLIAWKTLMEHDHEIPTKSHKHMVRMFRRGMLLMTRYFHTLSW